jgi:glycosyltransferase involved in cell wall biosynthesis
MKIFYDHQIFNLQEYGGISRYFYELINRFKGKSDQKVTSTILSNNHYLKFSKNAHSIPFFPRNKFRGKDWVMNLVNKSNSERILKQGNFDVFHPTSYDSYFLRNLKGRPFVLTVYDLITEKLSAKYEYLATETKIMADKKLLIQNANKIIAISKNTKKDIIEYYDVEPSRIEVIYLGNSFDFNPTPNLDFIQSEYVLFVGNRWIYKNFTFFLKSVSELLLNHNLKLVCAGGPEFSIEERELIIELCLENNIIHKKSINNDLLSSLYSKALFFVFPSVYEGFGIPILEAFACKCPVLMSKGSSMEEVGEDAAAYFDPFDSNSMYKEFSEMINNSDLRNKLSEKGTKRVRDFSWDKTFTKTCNVYNSLK